MNHEDAYNWFPLGKIAAKRIAYKWGIISTYVR